MGRKSRLKHERREQVKQQPEKSSRRSFISFILATTLFVAGSGSALWHLTRPEEKSRTLIDYTDPEASMEITFDNLGKLSSIEKILQSHPDPDVIFIPQLHQDELFVSSKPDYENRRSIALICNQLYDKLKVKSILFEGFKEEETHEYNQSGSLPLEGINPRIKEDIQLIGEMLDQRKWRLYGAEKKEFEIKLRETEKEAKAIAKKYYEQFRIEMEDLVTKNFVKTEHGFKGPRNFKATCDELLKSYESKIEEEQLRLMTDEKLTELYQDIVIRRDKSFANKCRECVNDSHSPIIVVYGLSHTKSFLKEINDLNILAILPKGNYEEKSFDMGIEAMTDFFRYGGTARTSLKVTDDGSGIKFNLEY